MVDNFSQRRIAKFITDFRAREGILPTLAHFAAAGFADDLIKAAIKHKVIEEFYVTLTSGTIVKGYKVCSP